MGWGKTLIVSATLAAALTTAGVAGDWMPCGTDRALCQTGGGAYALLLPDTEEPPPIFVYLHGYAASASGAARAKALSAPVLARGFAFLAPEGQVDPLQGRNLDWGVHDGFTWGRDDIAFVARVIDDAATRFGLNRSQVVLAGYSRGGSMVWDIACLTPGLATGYASYAGPFWEPMHTRCAGPMHIYHEHGFADLTVPFEGQRITFHGHPFVMGDVMKGLSRLKVAAGCNDKASSADTNGEVWLRRWTTCTTGSITLALGPGGHGRPDGWADRVLDWFAELPR